MTILSIDNLSKNYGAVQALKNVSFNVPAGTVFGILGPMERQNDPAGNRDGCIKSYQRQLPVVWAGARRRTAETNRHFAGNA